MATTGAASPAGVAVVVADTGIAISPPEALAGPVTFVFRNEGSVRYRIVVEGPGTDFEQPGLEPATAIAVTLTLAEGRYHITAHAEEDARRTWCIPLQVSRSP